MPTNIFMLPKPSEARLDLTNAIHRCVVMLERYLPEYNFTITEDPNMAELVVGHAGQTGGRGGIQVAHCHGLYPTSEPHTADWYWAANRAVIENLRSAKQITVPSEWVADILRRDMHANPHVVGWGIEFDEWTPGDDLGYVLWNKTRDDGVCNPQPLLDLAAKVPQQRFMATFGKDPTPNVKVIGRQKYETMRGMVQGASVYLATTLETFGIGTLEAMACGIPILGYDWGGTHDLVQHGVTGYLVAPGDVAGLTEGLQYCLAHRVTLGANAREVARQYTWQRVAERMAAVYSLALKPHQGPKVSIVILSHNYGHYLPGAIESVKRQQTTFDVEIIGVDNGSTDNTAELFREAGVRLIQRENDGPAGGRNAGITAARGEYIVCLDADDQLGDSRFVQTLAESLDNDPTLGIVFTGLCLIDETGTRTAQTNWPQGYDFDRQLQGKNQVPTCCMFRREAWQRAGGYRSRYIPAEDAHLWLTIGSLGYRAKQVINEPWFLYRWHDKSLSTPIRTQQRPEPNWRDFPWIEDRKLPFAADGNPSPNPHSWPVRNYNRPKVTVIIPVGKYHTHLLPDALDSVEAQSERNWECIVVNDSGRALDMVAYPWARVLDTGGGKGAGFARNRGIEAAKTKLITFLDADDVFDMQYLELTLREYALSGRYIYTDWRSLNKAGQLEMHTTPLYDPVEVFKQPIRHSINILIPREWVLAVGGFDEALSSWEDVDLFMKLAAAGYCGRRLNKPLMTYRYSNGQLREHGETIKPALIALFNERYGEYIRGEKQPECRELKRITTLQEGNYRVFPSDNGHGGMVRVEYQGGGAKQTVIGPATHQNYGRKAHGDIFMVWERDVLQAPNLFAPIADFADEIEPTPIPDEPELIHVQV